MQRCRRYSYPRGAVSHGGLSGCSLPLPHSGAEAKALRAQHFLSTSGCPTANREGTLGFSAEAANGLQEVGWHGQCTCKGRVATWHLLATGPDLPIVSQPALAIQLGPGHEHRIEDSARGSQLWGVSGQACGLRTDAKDTLGHTCVPMWLRSGPSQAGVHASLLHSRVGSQGPGILFL